MDIINGDILKIPTCGIICQQVNCKKTMGAGLAKQIRSRYPEVYDEYMHTEPRLGNVLFTRCSDDNVVASLYSQNGYGRDKQYTDYEALTQSLLLVRNYSNSKRLPVYIPYSLGCGLAGGDWRKVSALIATTLVDCDYAIVKLPGGYV